ncbi:MAG: hypothetical protein AAF654_12165 [Myxococcota bacterium]
MAWLVAIAALASASTESLLNDAQSALEEFQYAAALETLEQARSATRKSCSEMRRLEKLTGIAYASLGREVQAEVAFARLVSMDPAATLRYTLSPKVTFRFEAGREQVNDSGALRLELSAPFAQPADEPVPLRIRLARDPLGEVSQGTLAYRLDRGDWQTRSFSLTSEARVELPAFNSPEDATMSFYVEAKDTNTNCLYNVGSAASPRSIQLVYTYRPPRWPLWTGAALTGALAITGATFGLLSRNAQSVFDEETSRLSVSEQDPARRADAEDDARNFSRAANVSFIATGVSAVVTGALYLLFNDS